MYGTSYNLKSMFTLLIRSSGYLKWTSATQVIAMKQHRISDDQRLEYTQTVSQNDSKIRENFRPGDGGLYAYFTTQSTLQGFVRIFYNTVDVTRFVSIFYNTVDVTQQ